ncbi:MAG TPA: hypothetical protein VFJ19_17935 [Nocardioidaceae bacterium]|nr:hypothetical protein [Nocardioidaceae bacterium]
MIEPRPEPVDAATSFVQQRFPQARCAFVGGAVLTEHRTPTSDLDVVVVLDEQDGCAPLRETFEHEGWIVEAFVHTRDSLDRYWHQDAQRRSCALAAMCARSVVVADPAAVAAEIQRAAADRIAAGPPPADDEQVETMRYLLTDLLDDMAGCDKEDELAYLAGAVMRAVAELALVSGGRWGGTGKALARAVAEAEPDLAERLIDGHRHVVVYGDTSVLHRAAVDVLLRVGGPLLVGYRRQGE